MTTLLKLDSKNKIREWSAKVVGTDGCYVVRHGLQGGKIITDTTYAEAMNVGRSNATSPLQQATAEVAALYVKKIARDGYKSDLNDATKFIAPMLARDYTKLSHQVPNQLLYMSPKLDGARCIWDPAKKALVSRKGIIYHVPDVQLALQDVDETLDGELYIHGYPLNEIISGIKKWNWMTPRLEFHVFDLVSNSPYNIRDAQLKNLIRQIDNVRIKHVEQVVRDKSYIKDLHDAYVQQGYEGLMIRVPEHPYEVGVRSKSLYKYKEFEEAEFPITGVESDKEGGAVLVTHNLGAEFRVRCRGTDEYRAHQLETKDKLIGKSVTVRYQTISPFGVPIFPVGIAVRDYE